MTRLAAALVAAALLLPAGARAQGAQTQGCAPGSVWLDGKCVAVLSDTLTTLSPSAERCPDDPEFLCFPGSVSIGNGTGGEFRIKIPPRSASYQLLTISNGGTVSLIMGLTKQECDKAAKQLTTVSISIPADKVDCYALHPGETCPMPSRGHFDIITVGNKEPGYIKSAECFQ